MATRVIGKGMCPKCGNEGSVVLKEISGRIYVYMKHGRRWCYLGPIDKVDLSTVLSSLDYHTFTTKFSGVARLILGAISMRISALFVLGLGLLLSAYGLGTTNPSVSLTLTILSILVFLTAITLYESIRIDGKRYGRLMKVLSKGAIAYVPFMIIMIFTGIFVTLPIASPIVFTVKCWLPAKTSVPEIEEVMAFPPSKVSAGKVYVNEAPSRYVGIQVPMPLTTIVLVALIVTYLLRPVKGIRTIAYLIVACIVAYTIYFMLPLLIHVNEAFMTISVLRYFMLSMLAPIATIAFTLVYMGFISVLKDLIKT